MMYGSRSVPEPPPKLLSAHTEVGMVESVITVMSIPQNVCLIVIKLILLYFGELDFPYQFVYFSLARECFDCKDTNN